jgi:hypothetical protein
MPLMTLGIPPDANGYKAVPGNAVVSVDLDGGDPRVRGDKVGIVSTVDVQWTVGTDDFDYLMAFFRTGAGANGVPGCLPFFVDLVGIDSSQSQTYTAKFVPGTFGLKSQSGLTYIVGAQLWVFPNPPSNADDLETLARYS